MTRVLFVEECVLIRNFMRKLFKRRGFCVLFAMPSKLSPKLLSQRRVDIAVVNEPPFQSGCRDFLKSLHEQNIKPDIPVIYTYSDVNYTMGDYCMEYADTILPRPYDLEGLLQMIRSHVRRREEEAWGNGWFVNGEVTVDLNERIAYFRGKNMSLNRKEFKIFSILVRNPNTPITYTEIWQRVWGQGETDRHLIDCYISRLRRALGSPYRELLVAVDYNGFMLIEQQRKASDEGCGFLGDK